MGKKTVLRLRKLIVMGCICAALSGPALAAEELIPVGQVVGIQMDIEGVLVAGLSDVETAEGPVNPAAEAGIRVGDVILAVNERAVTSAREFLDCVEQLRDEEAILTIKRDGKIQNFSVCPAWESDGQLRLGLWLRDGIAGVGTVTYIDPETGAYGALGHGVNDPETGLLLPLDGGELCRAWIVDVVPGKSGTPGELCGCFEPEAVVGAVEDNTACGIFGTMNGNFRCSGPALPVAEAGAVRPGAATILSCVDGQTVAEYDVEICPAGLVAGDGRDLLVRVTDPELLAVTGGIVQGMSGSPIIQDGKLVGAVTHVLVNDPTRGYGILIENMLDAAG